MTEQSRTEESLFAQVVELSSAAERAAFLEHACGSNSALRAEVEALLRANARDGDLLDLPDQPTGARPEALSERPGLVIGPYKLMEQIGEGGMGLVFVAEQLQPIRRKVALKVIKPGMDTRQVIARFEAERQALALMDHPNIARVLDGGTTSSGRPYFVMELVKGVPITDYCDDNRLTPQERLALFLDVCAAVQHAHQKGIIHRDLKPSNVLVMSHDGQPAIKVIDFGVAKALGQQLTEKTVYTQFAQLVGTPLYMSPEQAGESSLDIDTRSDIYSLGVLLYELLTGTTPFDKERLHQAGYLEVRRILREEEPPKPSTRISTLGLAASTVSTQRRSDPRRLSQLMRGELDWIVMKALEKNRNRRYETASAFAADVRRYLNHETVQACPPSAWYRFRKFARRNRKPLGLAAAGVVLLLALAGTAMWSGQQRLARQARTEQAVTAALAQAETFLTQAEKQTNAPERWQATARQARLAVEKAEELLAAGAGATELTSRVKATRAAVDASLADSRLLVELDRIRLAQVSITLKASRYDQSRAAPLYAVAFATYGVSLSSPAEAARRVRASGLRETLLAALEDWRRITRDEKEQEQVVEVLRAAEPPYSFRSRWRAAARQRDRVALLQLTKDLTPSKLAPAAVVQFAADLQDVKAWDAAERLLRAAQERNPDDFWLNHDLGRVLLQSQPYTQAEQAIGYLRVALALRKDSAVVNYNLGAAFAIKNDFRQAMRQYQAALHIAPDFPECRTQLAFALRGRGEPEQAKQEFDAAIQEYRAALLRHPNDAVTHYNLGCVLWEKRDLARAAREFQAALQIAPNVAEPHNYLGLVLQNEGHLDDAIAEFKKAIHINSYDTNARNHLAGVLYDKHDFDSAIREWRAAIQVDPQYALLHSNLAAGLMAKDDVEGAIREYRQALHLDPTLATARNNLAEVAATGEDQKEIIQELRRAIRVEPDLAPVRPYFCNAYAWRLATSANLISRNPQRAIKLAKEAIATAPKGGIFIDTLGIAHYRAGQYQTAITELQKAIVLRGNQRLRQSATDAFFLAMAQWRLGNKLEARRWYQQALRWMDISHLIPNEDELSRFRVEAETLLHMGDRPKRTR